MFIAALQLEASVEIEKPAGPPKPPDYEGKHQFFVYFDLFNK